MNLEFAARTDVGRERKNNEDSLLVMEELKVFGVFDGMGGHYGGDIASSTASETVRELLTKKLDKSEFDAVLVHAHRALVPKGHYMGTTGTLVWFADKKIRIAHVGDSRVYQIRKGKLSHLTFDHNGLWQYSRMTGNKPTKEEVNAAKTTSLANCLGPAMRSGPTPETSEFEAKGFYLVFSDGLNTMLEDARILDIVKKAQLNPKECVDRLIDAANEAGGQDNITVVAIKVGA